MRAQLERLQGYLREPAGAATREDAGSRGSSISRRGVVMRGPGKEDVEAISSANIAVAATTATVATNIAAVNRLEEGYRGPDVDAFLGSEDEGGSPQTEHRDGGGAREGVVHGRVYSDGRYDGGLEWINGAGESGGDSEGGRGRAHNRGEDQKSIGDGGSGDRGGGGGVSLSAVPPLPGSVPTAPVLQEIITRKDGGTTGGPVGEMATAQQQQQQASSPALVPQTQSANHLDEGQEQEEAVQSKAVSTDGIAGTSSVEARVSQGEEQKQSPPSSAAAPSFRSSSAGSPTPSTISQPTQDGLVGPRLGVVAVEPTAVSPLPPPRSISDRQELDSSEDAAGLSAEEREGRARALLSSPGVDATDGVRGWRRKRGGRRDDEGADSLPKVSVMQDVLSVVFGWDVGSGRASHNDVLGGGRRGKGAAAAGRGPPGSTVMFA